MIRRFGPEDLQELCDRLRSAPRADCYAMYSSLYGGIVTDPALMTVPIDDHMVHRGDGIFEALKCVNGGLYNLAGHLDRLRASAGRLALRIPGDPDDIAAIVVETVRAGGKTDCGVRIFLSRGPGSFGVNPYDAQEQSLYVAAAALGDPFMRRHPRGAAVLSSEVPPKAPFFAAVKSCNYLPNVLMKKEAVDRGVDFVVSFNDRGRLTEGATENMGIVTTDGELRFPEPHGILRGTTMVRVAELASALVSDGLLTGVAFAQITRDDIRAAREVLLAGTTLNVAAVREFDGQPCGNGGPGPVYERLNGLLQEDILSNPELRTPVFPLPELSCIRNRPRRHHRI